MKSTWGPVLAALVIVGLRMPVAAADNAELARKAEAILKANCHRCHGQDGAVEGGMNYILDRDKLLTRKKIIPGHAEQSPLFLRVASGKMPPPDEQPRPSDADIEILKQWINAGAPGAVPLYTQRRPILEAEVLAYILADLETIDRRSRRFTRYFTLAHLYNAGFGEDELQTYRNALAKLINSLSWHPRITVPKAIDPAKVVLRIDLREFQWDANLWNRILAEYPYGILQDTAVARACLVNTATRLPAVRADWFVATASRPPLYHDLLQLPANLAELERQLRVDAAVNIQQERVARAGFNGSGVAKNNRLLERHDAIHGAYWRTYDFDAVQQNLVERDLLLPDRRNLFAFPLGPGAQGNNFQHAGGEVIWNLPNGLQSYLLVNANGLRVDKAPTAIVSDPKRPDRAVENGISCMGCHYRGINQKDDQIREFTLKNPKAFNRADFELIQSLYAPHDKMRKLMDEDAERFRKAVEKTGSRISAAEPITTITLRYEADVDLPTAAAEVGLRPDDLVARIGGTEQLARNLGALKAPGGTVNRQVFLQSFGDIVREFRLGVAFQPALIAQSLPDNTGEIDPLEAISSQANSMAFSPDGTRALFASADKTVRLWDVETNREIRRFIGHSASVWSVAFSSDGRLALSGSADRTVRLWLVETGREIQRMEGHTDLIASVAFSSDGRKAFSGSYDHTLILWDLEKGKAIRSFEGLTRYINSVTFSPDDRRALVCGEKIVCLLDLETGKHMALSRGHSDSVTTAIFSPDGKYVLSGGDDGKVFLWNTPTGNVVRGFAGQAGPVKSLAFSRDGKRALSGGADQLVRLWDAENGVELKRFARHEESVICVAFLDGGKQTLSGSRDAALRFWNLVAATPTQTPIGPNQLTPVQQPVEPRELRAKSAEPFDGPIGPLMLSPNGEWVYFLNPSSGTAIRLGPDKTHLAAYHLPQGTEAMFMSPDGKTLYALTVEYSVPRRGAPWPVGSSLHVLDADLIKRKTIDLKGPAFDLVARDDGVVFFSGARGEWTSITALDTKKDTVLATWGGVWTRSFLKMSPDQKRLYFSTQGVTPGQIEALVLPTSFEEKPLQYKSPVAAERALGGDFLIAPDGKHLLCKTGTVLRLSPNKDDDLKYAATVEPFLTAAIAPELGILVTTTKDNTLRRYSYPGFKLLAVYRLGAMAYQSAINAKEGRLYLAVVNPAALTGRPRENHHTEIRVYDLKEVLAKP